ncbi:ThuA-like domain-containing protein [Podospora aff. communis PSN243]|uniref:ThuA-like domain-containing protein n=1 Tax=Podospora aff. communis PSN243 TaxID=3040156 RepID=A0AAV9GBB1_9PEZI|nr:ThuA-like domain-containing protein [Podospora aff. communis PSN243]
MTSPTENSPPPFEVLIFSRTLAYRHDSITAGIKAITTLSHISLTNPGPHPFTTHPSEDPTVFTPSSLSRFAVILLLQCSGEFLDPSQLSALQSFVRAGGGVVAIHCASFAMEGSPWYGDLIGGVFESHPEPSVQVVGVVGCGHGIVRESLGKGRGMRRVEGQGDEDGGWEWEWEDEWYRYKGGNEAVRDKVEGEGGTVLLAGGDLGRENPIAWCRDFDGGRSFYTSLGHFDEAYEDEGFMAQVLGGILWAAGRM